ncbi:MAG: hypothetical protein H6596_08585 [Flavobacteriales bacterium]|nr:hypothetical protein [Flavobacteriales bacterium]MCB9200529.1 hypothetical protein [Flavobacteriales bacterium]
MRAPLIHLLCLLCVMAHLQASGQVAIGEWQDHFPYRDLVDVEVSGSSIHGATSTAVYRYGRNTGEIERFTKVNALSDVGISTVRWVADRQLLLIGYGNGNLDLLTGTSVINLPDIKRSNILGDKGVYSIEEKNGRAYLCCGFGVVVVDLDAVEVEETWLIGPAGSQLQANGLAFFQDSIHVATEDGLFSAFEQAPNLASFENWRRRSDVPSSTNAITNILVFGDTLLISRVSASEQDTVFALVAGQWTAIPTLSGNPVRSLSADGHQALAVCFPGWVRWFDASFAEIGALYDLQGVSMNTRKADIGPGNEVFIATGDLGLIAPVGSSQFSRIEPNGPTTTNNVRLDAAGGAVYVATGGVEGNYTNKFLKDGVHHLQNGEWRTTDRSNNALMATGANTFGGAVNDILDVVVDPDDPDHAFAASWDDGLLEFRDRDLVAIYNPDNSTLQINGGLGAENKVELGGLAFDAEGNLWMTNSNCAAPIAVRTPTGSWRSFAPGAVLNNNSLMRDILPATNGLKWIIRPRSQGMLVFNDNGTLSNTSDDQYKALTTFEGSGGLPSLDVLSMAEDLDGEIWVGTGRGVAVFYNPDAVFSGGDFDAQQILIEQDGNIQVLLETEAVSAIAVDGANRKWLGTQSSGVFLVSPDGTEQVLHFTVENSPLPSNTITDLAIDGESGEVFIGTEQGILSYRSDASAGLVEASCATVFPNPVDRTYDGPITITGMMRDSDVRITDISGNLVYRTTSLGGQAIWPGTDLQGQEVSTGVYLIFATDPTGSSKCNTKVLVVR